jgi:hypothetical protein
MDSCEVEADGNAGASSGMTLLRALPWLLLTVPLTASVSCGLISTDDEQSSGGSTFTDDGGSGGLSTGGNSDDSTGGATNSGGTGAAPGNGGSGTGGACTTDDRTLFDCPDVCTALAQLSCEVASPYPLIGFWGSEGDPVINYDIGGADLECFYRDGDLVGASIWDEDFAGKCGEPSWRILTWGEQPSQDHGATLPPEPCVNIGLGGASGEPRPAQCYSKGWNQCGDCCPKIPPACASEPNFSYQCNTAECDCQCLGGEWSCDCL